ncbi:hypothetical protein DFH06DRAFT_157562 [Mycena polygramma]|nr:hypothetical protein DFH06DRAFT_157562 [Mycena polygramma]
MLLLLSRPIIAHSHWEISISCEKSASPMTRALFNGVKVQIAGFIPPDWGNEVLLSPCIGVKVRTRNGGSTWQNIPRSAIRISCRYMEQRVRAVYLIPFERWLDPYKCFPCVIVFLHAYYGRDFGVSRLKLLATIFNSDPGGTQLFQPNLWTIHGELSALRLSRLIVAVLVRVYDVDTRLNRPTLRGSNGPSRAHLSGSG